MFNPPAGQTTCRAYCLFDSVPQRKQIYPVLGEKIAYATVSLRLYIPPYLQVQSYPPLRQAHSNFRDFNSGAGHVMTITIVEK